MDDPHESLSRTCLGCISVSYHYNDKKITTKNGHYLNNRVFIRIMIIFVVLPLLMLIMYSMTRS